MKPALVLLAASLLAAGASAAEPTNAPAVPTIAVAALAGGGVADFDGVLQPLRQATLTAQVGGNVLALRVKAGDVVKRGQPLVRIDDRDSRAGVARSDAAVTQAEAEARNAEVALNRSRDLKKSGFVSQAGVRTVKLFQAIGWQGVGPFHEFWLNLHANRTQQRSGGRTIEQQLYPGLYATANPNVEWTLDLHLHDQLRATPQGPLMAQRYISSGLIITPASWFPLLDTTLSVGRLADTQDERLRPGLRWTTTAKLRPLPQLELEPTWSTSWLRGDGQRRYDEGLLNLLAVWHLGPRRGWQPRAVSPRKRTRILRTSLSAHRRSGREPLASGANDWLDQSGSVSADIEEPIIVNGAVVNRRSRMGAPGLLCRCPSEAEQATYFHSNAARRL